MFEQMRLSTSVCVSVKGWEEFLGSAPCRKWKASLGFVLERGAECEFSNEMRGAGIEWRGTRLQGGRGK